MNQPLPPASSFWRRYLMNEAPFMVLVLLGMIGIAYTDITVAGSFWYWQMLVPVYALVIITQGWHRAKVQKRHMYLLITQFFHWGAFLAVMRLVFTPVVQNNLYSNVTGQTLLLLLSLSTFLAGIYVNWRLCIVGIFLAVGVAVAALAEQVIFLMLMMTVAIIVLSIFWAKWLSSRRNRRQQLTNHS